MSRFHSETLFDSEPPDRLCHFGAISIPLAAFLATDVGLGVTAGTIGAGVIEGGALGAATSAITGGDPLTGALGGAFTGGAVGAAGAFGAGAIGQAAAGAGAGAIGAELTGQSPLTGALTGGAAGAIAGSGLMSGASAGPATSPTSITGGSAVGGAAGAAATAPTSITPPASAPFADPTSGAGSGSSSPAAAAAPSLASPGGSAMNSAFGSDFTSGLLASPDVTQGGFTQQTTPLRTAPNVANQITGSDGSSGIGGFMQKNPGAILGGAALGANLLFGNKPTAQEGQLQTQANEAQTMATTLTNFQLTGTLPAGLQAVVDRYHTNAEAGIKSKYAELGLSGSTGEAQALSSARQESAVQVAQIADQLATQGLRWEQMSSQDLENLIHAQQARDQSFTSALSTFAAGLAGMKFAGGGAAGGNAGGV